MKKSIFATFLMVATALTTNVRADTWDCSPAGSTGTCTATLDANGKMTISGTGPMKDFTVNSSVTSTDTPWKNKLSQIKSVEISSGITTIGVGSFHNATNLKTITVADTVERIRSVAFKATALETVNLPDSVKQLDYGAFHSNTSLVSVNLPGVTTTAGYIFEGSTALTNVSAPSLVTTGNGNFKSTGITSITLPDTLDKISICAFELSQLQSITIPASVKKIDENAFNESRLKSVTFEDGVESIEYRAFRWTDIQEIVLPDTVKFIDDEAFSHCMSLTSFTFTPRDDLVIDSDAFHDITPGQLTFKCAGELEKCRAKLNAAGYSSFNVEQAAYDIKDENGKKIRHVNADGTYYDYPEESENAGNGTGTHGKRIYTVEEARAAVEAAGTDTVSFRIRYK